MSLKSSQSYIMEACLKRREREKLIYMCMNDCVHFNPKEAYNEVGFTCTDHHSHGNEWAGIHTPSLKHMVVG